MTDPSALDDTVAALDGPLSALTPSAAVAVIDRWRVACSDAGLGRVADGLDALREQLSGDRLDGGALAGTLRELADATREADMSDARLRPGLDRLAATLDRAAEGVSRR